MQESMRHVQIADVSRCTQGVHIKCAAAGQDSRALRNTYSLSRGRPLVSGHTVTAAATTDIRVHPEYPSIHQLKHGAIA